MKLTDSLGIGYGGHVIETPKCAEHSRHATHSRRACISFAAESMFEIGDLWPKPAGPKIRVKIALHTDPKKQNLGAARTNQCLRSTEENVLTHSIGKRQRVGEDV